MTKTPSIILICLCAALARADVLLNVGTVHNLVIAPTLSDVLSSNLFSLANNTNATWDFTSYNFGTNSALWTWPINLSCVGRIQNPSGNYCATLISENEAVYAGHVCGYNPSAFNGYAVAFMDTNGNQFTAFVSNSVAVYEDMYVAIFSNSLPATISVPMILPTNYPAYFSNHNLVGLPAIWPRNDSGTMQLMGVFTSPQGSEYGTSIGSQMGIYGWTPQSLNSPWSQGYMPQGGDSSGPTFLVFGNQPVFLFALHTGSSTGPSPSDPVYWSALSAAGLASGLQMLNLSGFRQF